MIAATAFILGAAAIGGYTFVSAAEVDDKDNPMNALVSAIAEKFNLNSSEVQSVVDDVMETQREEMQAQHEQEFKDRISKAVSDGKLTQAQADLIEAKKQELRSQMDNVRDDFKNLSEDERKAKMDERRDEMKKWAEDNNITEDMMHMFGEGRGFGESMGRGPKF